jgi:hypothetical protein
LFLTYYVTLIFCLNNIGREGLPDKGSKEYIRILELAAKENEALVDDAIERLIVEDKDIRFETIKSIISEGAKPEGIREIIIMPVEVSVYDQLLNHVVAA